MGFLHHPFWLKLLSVLLVHYFSIFSTTFFGQRLLTRVQYPKAHMVHHAWDATTEAPPSKTPQKDGDTISLRPYNTLRQIDVGSAKDKTYLVSDPRLFFLGAPSSYSESVQASFLRNVSEAALHVPSRYAVMFWPPELSHIKKEESAVVPDGIIYKLGNVWFKKETTLCNVSTQILSPMDAPPTGTPSEDKATQVGIIMQWVTPEEPEK